MQKLVETAGPQVSVKTQQESVRRGESVTLRCEAEGDAPLDLSWRARDSRVDPNYDVRFVSKLIKSPSLPSRVHVVGLSLRPTIDETDISISIDAEMARGLIAIATRNAALIKLRPSTRSNPEISPLKITTDEEEKKRGTHVRRNPPPFPRGLPRGIHPVHSGRFHSAERVTARHSWGKGGRGSFHGTFSQQRRAPSLRNYSLAR